MKDWRNYFNENIIRRGEAYYRKGKVIDFAIDGRYRTATVLGSDEYEVKLMLKSNGELGDAFCTCPYAEQGEYCKHMAAVLLTEENGEKIDGACKSISSKKKKTNASESKLDEKTGVEVTDFKQEIKEVISKYKHRGYIEYRDAYDCAVEVSEILGAAATKLLNEGKNKEAFDCAFFAMKKFSGTDMDDSDGGTTMVCTNCIDYIENAITDVKTEEYAFRKILNLLKNPNEREWYANDLLEDFLLTHFYKREFYSPIIEFLNKKLNYEESRKNSYGINECLAYKLSYLRETGEKEEEIGEIQVRYWGYEAVEKDYVEYAIANGEVEDAERVLQEFIDLSYEYGVSSEYCREKLMEIYGASKQTEKYRAVLYDFVAYERRFEMEKYFELKELYSEKEWGQVRDELLEQIKATNREYYPQVLYAEGLKERLLQYVLQVNGLYLVQEYEKYLVDDYLAQIVEKYEKELRREIEAADNRKRYQAITRTLRRLNRYKDGKEIVRELVEEWREKYARRRALMEELDKVII